MTAHLLALDAGTGSGRAAIFDASGRLLACAGREWGYEVAQYPGDFVAGYQFDAEKFWAILCEVTREALERAAIAPRDIVGVAATSQREGSVFLDAAGVELLATPNFDSRGFMEGVDVLERLGGPERLYRLTGHVPPFIFALSRLLWWRKRFPERPVAKTLMISDWVTYRLTGERVAEPTNAVESLLCDVSTLRWSEDIAEACELPRSLLPTLVSCGAPIGAVHAAAAAATGILEGTPVFAGGADTQCALLGSGVVAAGEVGAVLGTTGPVQRVLDSPVFDDGRQLWVGAHVVPGRWILESNAGDLGKAYLWMLELFGLEPRESGEFAHIEAEAETASAEAPVYAFLGPSIFDLRNLNPGRAAGMLFPYPFGRRRPKRAEFLLGFLENVAYAVRANLEQIEAATGEKIDHLTVGGGMTQSGLLCRLISQVTQIPLRVSRVTETAALGCAMLAGIGARVYRDFEDAVATAVAHDTVEPPAIGGYAERYKTWRELFSTLNSTTVP
jgi:sugar (pentulose or hexulose) kinase